MRENNIHIAKNPLLSMCLEDFFNRLCKTITANKSIVFKSEFGEVISIKKYLMNPMSMFLLGLVLGVISRLFDIYSETLGNIFSQMAIWIFLGTLIAIYSPTKKKAMLNIFPFCIGMLIAYYATAIITHGVYGRSFIIGWTVFAFCSPIFAFFAWMTKERGWFPKIISIGIVMVSVLSSILLFDRLRFYDFIIDALLTYFLFFKKLERQ